MPNALISASTFTPTELDAFAWKAICEWPHHSGTTVVYEGLDYGRLTRCYLWDKVPRALRQQVTPTSFSFEQDLLVQQRAKGSGVAYPQWKRQVKQPFQALRRVASSTRMKISRRIRSAPVILVPRQHSHLRTTLSALLNDTSLRLVAPVEHGTQTGIRLFETIPPQSPSDGDFVDQLHSGMVRGLQHFDIELLPADQQQLKQQLLQQRMLVRQVEAEIAVADPQAVLVFADTHTPLQEYVAVANRQGITTILLQHGLDCEQYCLNETQSSVVAVWGEARKRRYQQQSPHQPKQIAVTGNPEFDGLRLPATLCKGGDRWVWATRPHGSSKCLLPSRHPHEGLEILNALLSALKQHTTAQLVIKPHPLDYIGLYEGEIEKQGMSDRVTIDRAPLQSVLPSADIVISEDSTAAMEAMFFGKIVVHAHFADSAPVLPLADYGAALPANSPAALQNALNRALTLTTAEQQQLQQGQHQFIQGYAGSLDGQACQRVISLISQAVFSTTK